MDVCSNHPPNCKGGGIIKTVIGIDIGKKMCYCVMRTGKFILEEGKYPNATKDAACLAVRLKSQHGKCSAVCETTGNMTYKTYYAFEDAPGALPRYVLPGLVSQPVPHWIS